MNLYQNICWSVLLCVQCYQALEESYKTDLTWVQSTIATRYDICSDYFVVDNMVYMGTINNSNNTKHILICCDRVRESRQIYSVWHVVKH